jgi:hypothetical protein
MNSVDTFDPEVNTHPIGCIGDYLKESRGRGVLTVVPPLGVSATAQQAGPFAPQGHCPASLESYGGAITTRDKGWVELFEGHKDACTRWKSREGAPSGLALQTCATVVHRAPKKERVGCCANPLQSPFFFFFRNTASVVTRRPHLVWYVYRTCCDAVALHPLGLRF